MQIQKCHFNQRTLADHRQFTKPIFPVAVKDAVWNQIAGLGTSTISYFVKIYCFVEHCQARRIQGKCGTKSTSRKKVEEDRAGEICKGQPKITCGHGCFSTVEQDEQVGAQTSAHNKGKLYNNVIEL